MKNDIGFLALVFWFSNWFSKSRMKVIFFKGILRDKIETLIFDRTYSRFSVGPNSLRNFAFNRSQHLLYSDGG